jgi:RNA polymerase sigma-70 factor, ECF subfamily
MNRVEAKLGGVMSKADEDRFCTLYEAARPHIVAYALRRTASREEAADIVSETFEIAWRRLKDVPDDPDGLLWLYVTARHVLANSSRRIHRRDELTVRLAEGLRAVDVVGDPVNETGILALSSLRSLPAEDRELLMLTAWEGLSSAEVGRILGCSPTAARIRLHRARARLNAEMNRSGVTAKQVRPGGHQQGSGEAESLAAPEEVVER